MPEFKQIVAVNSLVVCFFLAGLIMIIKDILDDNDDDNDDDESGGHPLVKV